MTTKELAALVMRIRALFGGQSDEDIFALHVRWMKDRDFSVCTAALDQYALDYGGSLGRFIPSKFREYHDRVSSHAAEIRRLEATRNRRTLMNLGVSVVELEWIDLRRKVNALDAESVDKAVSYLVSLGWHRPDGDNRSAWPRTWILAVLDLAADREVGGVSARLFYARACPPTRKPPQA